MIEQTRIGAISQGVDGQDLYLLIKDSKGITQKKVEAFFNDYYRAETTQEAGGYFCHFYRWLPMNDTEAVLIIYHQYDI
jgi:hypothetical protein